MEDEQEQTDGLTEAERTELQQKKRRAAMQDIRWDARTPRETGKRRDPRVTKPN